VKLLGDIVTPFKNNNMKEIKNFKDIKNLSFMCMVNPKKPTNQKYWEWEVEYEQEVTENADLFFNTFKKGDKKIQKDLFEFLEMYYHLKILPESKGVTMYHGTRQVLCLQIVNGKPYIHYQNKIESNFDEVIDYENDNTHEIKGKYQFNYDPRIWDFKNLLVGIFNRYNR
jgi:23S rRNA G2069 N7-methylase RlmK/C1962 C5-methylase RlmI